MKRSTNISGLIKSMAALFTNTFGNQAEKTESVTAPNSAVVG